MHVYTNDMGNTYITRITWSYSPHCLSPKSKSFVTLILVLIFCTHSNPYSNFSHANLAGVEIIELTDTLISAQLNNTTRVAKFADRYLNETISRSGREDDSRFLNIVKSKLGCPTINRFTLNHLGDHITVLSPNYPLSYPKITDCKYHFSSPPGTKMKLKCDVTVPPRIFHKCQKKPGDFFQVSLRGDDSSSSSKDNYKLCGRYWLKAFSSGNQLLIGIHGEQSNLFSLIHPAKSFKCKIKVIKNLKGSSSDSSMNCGSANVDLGFGGRKNNKILGGSVAGSGQFPWRCGLQIVKGGAVTRTCTCSIISNEWILTSTHCINNEEPGNVFVFVGSTSFTGVGAGGGGMSVSQVVKNNKFGAGLNDDVGVVKLSQPLTFSSTVRPICLPCPFKGQQFIESKVTISGFVEGPPGTFTLLTKGVMTMKRSDCRKFKPINMDEICIYEPGKVDCVTMGDTGSYSDFLDPATGISFAAGVDSWGDACGSETKPSIHQNVARFIDWIETNTGTKFCV